MKRTLKDFVQFTRSEQRGALVLLALLLALSIMNPLVPVIFPGKDERLWTYEKELDSLFASLEEKRTAVYAKTKKQAGEVLPVSFQSSPFIFDPNTLDMQGWIRTGLPEKLIGTIMNYRKKGGIFRTREDLKKIYGFKEEYYLVLSPYIRITPQVQVSSQKQAQTYHATDQQAGSVRDSSWSVELNVADTTDLVRCRGIGPYYAARIIRYRELLGGYLSKEQLLEIRGIDSARYALFQEHVTADPACVSRIDLNRTGFKELLRHPYFDYEMVKAVFDFRKAHGKFDSTGQLREIPLIGEQGYRKVADYVTTGPPP